MGAALAAAAVIVVLVRIAAAAPNGSIPTTSAPQTVLASEPPAAATDMPVEVSPPAAATDSASMGPTEWVDPAAAASGPTSATSGPPDPDPPTDPTADAGTESPAPIEAGPVDWWSVLAQLDRARASALAAREASALDAYAVPGSPAWNQDAALIGDLQARGIAPVGLATRLVGIEQAPEEADHGPRATAELVIVDERSTYSLVDDGGAVVEQVPASGLRRWRVRLAGSETADGGLTWLLQSAEPMP